MPKYFRSGKIRRGNKVLFLIRTYAGHFDTSNVFNILNHLQSLQKQEHTNWVAVLFNTDTKPLPKFSQTISKMLKDDPRIQMMYVPVNQSYNLWDAGYRATDLALEQLVTSGNADFDWLVVTNGDNIYEPHFLSQFSKIDCDTDIVAVDFWSRYPRVGETVTSFSATRCQRVAMKRGYVDLGGAILSFPRFLKEGHKFSALGDINSQDGFMISKLSYMNWRPKLIRLCLYSHSPNPYACSKLGGVWWNSPSSLKEFGDACLTKKAAEDLMNRFSASGASMETSETGIKYVMLPDPYHTQNKKQVDDEALKFATELFNRLKVKRQDYCEKLKLTGWKLNPEGYSKLNPDLRFAGFNDLQLDNHFWRTGCAELRLAPNVTESYFSAQIRC